VIIPAQVFTIPALTVLLIIGVRKDWKSKIGEEQDITI